jgi:hypothetical protein
MEILSDEIGDKPPTPEKALTIFAQTPAAGTTFDPNKPPSVKVKRYGSAKTEGRTATASSPFVGTWVGKCFYHGDTNNPPSLTMFIRQDPDGSLSIWVEGYESGYPLEPDGATKLRQVGFFHHEIVYELVDNNTLHGIDRYEVSDGIRSVPRTRETILKRK